MTVLSPVLPDLLAPRLKVVFCGTAAGRLSALRGHYYAHPQNKFWRALHAAGLTPRLLRPDEFPELLKLGIGLTDIAKHAAGMDKELPPQSLGRDACADLTRRVTAHGPDLLAFTSLAAARHFLRRPVTFGPQPEVIGATRLWALPSPSPVAQWNWDESWWRALGNAARKKRPRAENSAGPEGGR